MKKTKILQYSISGVLGAAMVIAICFIRKVFWVETYQEVMRYLCDAFFVSGVLLFCAGLLVFCYNGGVFDLFTYAAGSFARVFVPVPRRSKRKTFTDYRLDKHREPAKLGFLLLVGAIYLAVSVVFLILYLAA